MGITTSTFTHLQLIINVFGILPVYSLKNRNIKHKNCFKGVTVGNILFVFNMLLFFMVIKITDNDSLKYLEQFTVVKSLWANVYFIYQFNISKTNGWIEFLNKSYEIETKFGVKNRFTLSILILLVWLVLIVTYPPTVWNYPGLQQCFIGVTIIFSIESVYWKYKSLNEILDDISEEVLIKERNLSDKLRYLVMFYSILYGITRRYNKLFGAHMMLLFICNLTIFTFIICYVYNLKLLLDENRMIFSITSLVRISILLLYIRTINQITTLNKKILFNFYKIFHKILEMNNYYSLKRRKIMIYKVIRYYKPRYEIFGVDYNASSYTLYLFFTFTVSLILTELQVLIVQN